MLRSNGATADLAVIYRSFLMGRVGIEPTTFGIKSPAEEAAAKCEKLKQPANRTRGRCSNCNEPCHVETSVYARLYARSSPSLTTTCAPELAAYAELCA